MNILIIAYSFPPSSSSSTFRPMFFAQHLQKMGESVYVLTAREQDYLPEQPKDYKLLDALENTIEIAQTRVFRPRESVLRFRDRLYRKTGEQETSKSPVQKSSKQENHTKKSFFQECKDIITDLLSTPDQHIGWLPSAVRQGHKMIKAYNIDILYATGGPWTSLLIGSILKKMTGRPLVLDFRDPWVSNPSRSSDSKIMLSLEPFMEKKVITFSDHIVANTEELRQDFLRRYPTLNQNFITTIPNGFETFIDLQTSPEQKKLTFTHAGTLYFSRNPKFLLQALLRTIELKNIPKENLSFVFLGGIDVSIQDPELEHLVKHPLLKEVIHILPRLPYDEAAQYQQRSDVLFLLQPDFPLQVPRKLYEYMAFRKPILGITNPDGATARIIQENNLGIVVENQASRIELVLQTVYKEWRNGLLNSLSRKQDYESSHNSFFQDTKSSPDSCSMTKWDKFLNKNLTKQLWNIFNTCLERK